MLAGVAMHRMGIIAMKMSMMIIMTIMIIINKHLQDMEVAKADMKMTMKKKNMMMMMKIMKGLHQDSMMMKTMMTKMRMTMIIEDNQEVAHNNVHPEASQIVDLHRWTGKKCVA